MLHVLVIDDDPFILRMIERMLAGPDCTITSVQNGPDGIACYRRSPHDLVITDVAMPVTQGLNTIRQLRALAPSLPILVMSGGGWLLHGAELLDMALQAGATKTIAKPFTNEELRDAVSSCLSSVRECSSRATSPNTNSASAG